MVLLVVILVCMFLAVFLAHFCGTVSVTGWQRLVFSTPDHMLYQISGRNKGQKLVGHF